MSEPQIVTCKHCGTKNRVRAAATGVPVCGKCSQPLPWLVTVTTADFGEVVEKSPVPVLIDFWAPWCGPCRIVEPSVKRISEELAGKLKVAKLNTDEEPALSERFAIRGIPTLAVVESGQEKDRVTGALPYEQLRRWIDARVLQSGPAA
jgi:thioredoxin 2